MKNKYLAFVDCETSGLCPIRNDIVSLAMIITDTKGKELDRFYQKCRPEFNVYYSKEAERIHGFTRDTLKGFQERRELLISLLWFLVPYLSDSSIPFIFHANGKFDYKFVEGAFRKEDLQYSFWKVFNHSNTISTINLAKKIKWYKKNSLDAWAERLNLKLEHHNALSDTLCCKELYFYLQGVKSELV